MTDNRLVSVALRHEEALVLFDWLARFNANRDTEFEDQAEERVLFDLESTLEKILADVVQDSYQADVLRARDGVRDRQ